MSAISPVDLDLEAEAGDEKYEGLHTYDHEDEYELPALIPAEHQGYGAGKLGLSEVKFGVCVSKHVGKQCPIMRPIVFNPWTTLIGFGTLLGFALWCINDPINSKMQLSIWQSWVTKQFTWFYIGSQDVWIIFLFFVYWYYGDRKLGSDKDRPEFDNVAYFSMLFSCGVAVGMFVYGTAEPLYHYDYWLKQRFNGGTAVTDNDKANFAILTTIFHWGFHGFCVYCLVALQMGLMAYRKNLPMTMRSCFYPLFGKHTFGWIGTMIDGFSIVTIVAGVCTSLGLGAIQIRRGLDGMGVVPPEGWTADDQLLGIIWGITLLATISLLTGLHVGIKFISQLAFFGGVFILLIVLFLGHTSFFLNTMVQQTGYYLQYSMTQLGWHTDAFAQLGYGEGGAPDMLGASKAGQAYGGAPSFMDGWTIFYWGWWIAWSPFVGMFIARISRGRTIKEVVLYTMTGPLLFAIVWFSVFGGAAIQMENQAQMLWKAGAELYNDPSYFQAGQGLNAEYNFAATYASFPAAAGKTGFGSNCGKINITETGKFKGYCHPAGSGIINNKGCIPFGHKTASDLKTGEPKVGAQYTVVKNAAYFYSDPTTYMAGQGCGACFVQQAQFGNATFDETGTVQTGGVTGCQLWLQNQAADVTISKCPFWIKSWKADTGKKSKKWRCLCTTCEVGGRYLLTRMPGNVVLVLKSHQFFFLCLFFSSLFFIQIFIQIGQIGHRTLTSMFIYRLRSRSELVQRSWTILHGWSLFARYFDHYSGLLFRHILRFGFLRGRYIGLQRKRRTKSNSTFVVGSRGRTCCDGSRPWWCWQRRHVRQKCLESPASRFHLLRSSFYIHVVFYDACLVVRFERGRQYEEKETFCSSNLRWYF